jgi:Alpha/beta hydrolase domain
MSVRKDVSSACLTTPATKEQPMKQRTCTVTTKGLSSAVASISALVGLAALAPTEPAAGGSTPSGAGATATLSGPVVTGHIIEPLSPASVNLASAGYVEQEFFASGTASAFQVAAARSDGRWTVTPTSSAPYETRIIVRRPASATRFNGTVVVEWMNVTAGESAPDWDYLNPMLTREGYMWVGVSAQALGVNGGQSLLGSSGPSKGLAQQEPGRYGSLHHPGDQYALDMFAQIGRALRHPGDAAVIGPLHPRHVVAVGESQSAFYLTDFADGVQPLTHAFDGIFIHSRGGGGGGIATAASSGTDATAGIKGALRIRTDSAVPVFLFETQTDLTTLGYAAAQQANSARVHTWEVAGTSHADAYRVGNYAGTLGCTQQINDGPQHEVVQAAFSAFDAWVVHGTPPPSAAPFKLVSTNPATYALDKYGNVIGGVRTPAVDVPVSTLSGSPPPGSSVICELFGSATAFSASTLSSLYPTKANYIAAYTKSLHKAIKGGYILAADRAEMLARAQQAPIPG